MIINSFKYTGISNNLDEVLTSEEINNRIDNSDDLSYEEEIQN